MNPMVDGWRGDDWFHNGAFRQQGMSYIYDQEATRANDVKWWTSHFDDYDMFMEAGSAGGLPRRARRRQDGVWRKALGPPRCEALLRGPPRGKKLSPPPPQTARLLGS